MKLLDVITAPWAIEPAKLLEIQEIYATHLRGEKIDIAAVEARIGKPLDNTPKNYEVVDGVAIVAIEGVIAKRANLFMQISGGVSTELAARDLKAALGDPAVHSIILSIDSPGGTVDGTQNLADIVYAARDKKPVVSLASGLMASAAYWIGSAAMETYITDATTRVGSIGVVATHVDVSKNEEMRGIKTTEVFAGKFKRINSQYGPLTDSGRQSMQDEVDYLYSIFVDAVAKQRNVSVDTVLEDMADGRIFTGEQAIAAGLVDGVSTMEALISKLNNERVGVTRKTSMSTPKEKNMLTAEQVAAEHPAIASAFRAEGAQAERERIQSVQAQVIPGHESLIQTLAFDGKSNAGDAAQAVLSAEKKLRDKQAETSALDAPKPLSLTPGATVKTTEEKSDEEQISVEEQCQKTWEKDAQIRSEFGTLAAYTGYAKAEQEGRARILKR